MLVYLAGPISGCTYDECVDWRRNFPSLLPEEIHCLSPMRWKEHLEHDGRIDGHYPDDVLSCQRGIIARDFNDCKRANIIVANFIGAERVSIGTCMEVAWCYASHTPLVAIMEPESNSHDHPMIREAISFRVTTLQEAADVVTAVLCPPGYDSPSAATADPVKIPQQIGS